MYCLIPPTIQIIGVRRILELRDMHLHNLLRVNLYYFINVYFSLGSVKLPEIIL